MTLCLSVQKTERGKCQKMVSLRSFGKKKKKEGEKECDYLQVIGSIYQIETRLKKNKLRTSRLNKKAPVIQEHGTHFQF